MKELVANGMATMVEEELNDLLHKKLLHAQIGIRSDDLLYTNSLTR